MSAQEVETAEIVDEVVEATEPSEVAADVVVEPAGKAPAKPVQPRIDELTRKHRESEREAAYWRQRATANEAKQSADAAPKEPVIGDFTDYGDYVKALAKFEAKAMANEAIGEMSQRSAQERKAEAERTEWQKREAAARAKLADYDTVVCDSDVSVLDHVVSAIKDSDLGPEIIHYLARHPEAAEKLNTLSPTAAAREIGRLEVTLSTPQTNSEPDEVTENSPAPKPQPPAPAKTLSAAKTVRFNPATATMAEYEKHRRAEGARWAR